MAGRFCPDQRLVWLLWANGYYGRFYINCGRWSCPACAAENIESIGLALAEQAGPEVWAGSIAKRLVEAARRRARKTSVDYLAISLESGAMILVSSWPLKGTEWRLTKRTTESVIVRLAQWNGSQPTRQTWRGWKKSEARSSERGPALFRHASTSPEALKAKVEAAGLDWNADHTEDPDGAAERLQEVFAEPAVLKVRKVDEKK